MDFPISLVSFSRLTLTLLFRSLRSLLSPLIPPLSRLVPRLASGGMSGE